MKIFSMKPGHDGAIAMVDAERRQLLWSHEPEKDSFPRYQAITPTGLLEAAAMCEELPDVMAVSGWGKTGFSERDAIGAGYYGVGAETVQQSTMRLFGSPTRYFSSSHERSHIWSAYGLSPFPQGQPVYVLIWEGELGDFYEVDEQLVVHHIGTVMRTPGNRYCFLYALADPTFTLPRDRLRLEDSGKLMALCAYGEPGPMTPQEQETTDFLFNRETILRSLGKDDMTWSPYHDIGLETPAFTRLARRFSDRLFDRFHQFARQHLTKGHPLLVVGGCGLNCDWNTMWRQTGLFQDVFVPPCTNDTGSAIGTAIDAMRELTGQAKVDWTVYCGQDFVEDTGDMPDVETSALDLEQVARFINDGHIVAWTQGRCEIGPRALGNRSILAAPFSTETRDRLNAIKRREGFRPIAPICLETEVADHFDWQGPSPYMLYFQHVKNPALRAVTHVDGTARVQTVTASENPRIHDLLQAFSGMSGVGVLCNTSLNFNGTGFINRTSDLYAYCRQTGIDGFVFGDTFCRFRYSL